MVGTTETVRAVGSSGTMETSEEGVGSSGTTEVVEGDRTLL